MDKRFKNYFFIFLLIILILPNFVFAQLSDEAKSEGLRNMLDYAFDSGFDTGGDQNAGQSLSSYMALIIKGFLSLLGIIFIILIIYAGFTWMTAGGDENKLSKAKSTIARASIGLLIVLSAYAITAIVFGVLD